VGVLLALAIVIGVAISAGYFVYDSFKSLQVKIPQYQKGADAVFNKVSVWLSTVNINLEDNFVPWAIDYLKSLIPGLLSSVSVYLEKALLILIFLIYLLLTPSQTKEASEKTRSPRDDSTQDNVWAKVNESVRQFVITKGALSFVLGGLVAATLFVLGIDCALVFGLLTFISNFIPNVGCIAAVLAPFPLVVFDPDLTIRVQILAFVLPFLIHFIMGNFVEPKALGDQLELHPVIVLLSLIFWALLWGIAGMILAVPIMAVVRIILKEVGQQPDASEARKIVDILENLAL
jgi:predicted PurR-regulated permease PerM